MIEVIGIRKKFDSLEVLKGIDLRIERGEIVSIVGASGAGKTTLLQIMGTLEKPTSGKILYNGEEISELKEKQLSKYRNRHIGFVFQFHQLLPEFNALENVMMPALIGGENPKEAERKGKEILQFLNLAERMEHKPNQLSGGEKQRVAVARALINQPDIIYADEPSGSLDSEHKAELHQLILDLRKELGITFVIVTHDPHLSDISDRIIRIKDGMVY